MGPRTTALLNPCCRSKIFPPGKRGKNQATAFDKEIQYKKATSQPLPLADREGVYLDDLALYPLHIGLCSSAANPFATDRKQEVETCTGGSHILQRRETELRFWPTQSLDVCRLSTITHK